MASCLVGIVGCVCVCLGFGLVEWLGGRQAALGTGGCIIPPLNPLPMWAKRNALCVVRACACVRVHVHARVSCGCYMRARAHASVFAF